MSDTRRAIVLAVGGGIAAYKSAFLCSRLVQSGYEVRVALTRSALNFVGVSTFSALSGQSVATEVFQPDKHPLGAHIELAKGMVVKAVRNTIGDVVPPAGAKPAND